MAFAVVATWVTAPENITEVRESLEQIALASRQEPGNLVYEPHVAPDEPGTFRVFEIYEDEAAFQAHRASEHFITWGLNKAVPLLTSRDTKFYQTL